MDDRNSSKSGNSAYQNTHRKLKKREEKLDRKKPLNSLIGLNGPVTEPLETKGQNMFNNVNFYWAGDIIPYSTINLIDNWAKYLSRSKDDWKGHSSVSEKWWKVCLWLDEKSYRYFVINQEQLKCKILRIEDVDSEDVATVLSLRSFHQFLVKPLNVKNMASYPKLVKYYRSCINYKLYAGAVDVAKLIILYRDGGIYLDCDIQPSLEYFFPSPKLFFNELKSMSVDKFCIHSSKNGVLESQLLFSNAPPVFMRVLLDFVEKRIEIDFLGEELIDFKKWSESDCNKKFNHYVVEDPNDLFRGHLNAFRNNDAEAYRTATSNIFDFLMEKGELEKEFDGELPFIDGHHPWLSVETVYVATCDFFDKILDDNPKVNMLYSQFYRSKIAKFFDNDQDNLPLFTWADPGYSSLRKFNQASLIIKKLSFKKSMG